jgi:hypothetical protein
MPKQDPESKADKARRKHKPYVHVPEPEPWEAAIPEKSSHNPFAYVISAIMVVITILALWMVSTLRSDTKKAKVVPPSQTSSLSQVPPIEQSPPTPPPPPPAPEKPSTWPPGYYKSIFM